MTASRIQSLKYTSRAFYRWALRPGHVARSFPTVLVALAAGCSDDGATQVVVVADAGADGGEEAGVTDVSSTSGETATVTSESTSQSMDTQSSSASGTVSDAPDAEPPANTGTPDGGDTVDGSTGDQDTRETSTTDAEAVIDWTDPPTGIECADSERCVNEINSVVALGYGTCAVKSDGVVWCWGSPLAGDLSKNPTPQAIEGLTDVASMSGCWATACALKEEGSVWCWGVSTAPIFGPDSVLVESDSYDSHVAASPLQVPGLEDIKAVGTGADHACAIKADGSVWCWGSNADGQLGRTDVEVSVSPVHVEGLPRVRSIVAGAYHTCAISLDGDVYCWGLNHRGQLGDGSVLTLGDERSPLSATPQRAVGVDGAVKLASGLYSTCAIEESGETKCWGNLYWTDLDTETASTPAAVAGFANATDIAVGYTHACAVFGDGHVSCVGSNQSGALGVEGENELGPVVVASVTNAKLVAVNGKHSCAVDGSGQLSCWGDDYFGQLGDGSLPVEYSAAPLAIASDAAFKDVAVGQTTCGVKTNGQVACWGDNGRGQLGIETSDLPHSYAPLDNPYLSSVVALSNGDGTLCALLEDATVSCWGDNGYGQLGDPTFLEPWSTTPIAVQGLSGVLDVQTAGGYACALLDGGTVHCWGNNDVGQLGQELETAFSFEPMPVPNVTGAVELAVGAGYACARLADQSVTCWGRNVFGLLGDDNPTPPNVVPDFAGATALETTGWTVCLLNPDATVSCTSEWFASQDAGIDNSLAVVEGLSNVASLSGNCVLRNEGSVACWEMDAPQADGGIPTTVTDYPELGATTALDADQAYGVACAVLAQDSSIMCWGNNYNGELGLGEGPSRPSAQPVAW